MNEQKRDALAEAIDAHVYVNDLTGSALCTCGWPESRRDFETDLQTAHRAHLAEALLPLVDTWLAEAWEQAHAVFCPRAAVCSTHLRPGDRHLLALDSHDTEAQRVTDAVEAALRLIAPDHITPMGARQVRAAMENVTTRGNR